MSRSEIVAAASRLARDGGLSSVTLRAVGEALGVSSMTIHRTVGGSESLRSSLVSEWVGLALADTQWPEDDWRALVEVFALRLRDLLFEHPFVLEAHRQSALDGPGAEALVRNIVASLEAAGLTEEQAVWGYAAVHDFVTGYVAVALGRAAAASPRSAEPRGTAALFNEYRGSSARFGGGITVLTEGLAALMKSNQHQ